MSRIYVASSWRNPYQADVVKELRSAGHQVYDFRNPPNGIPGFRWSEIDTDWLNWSAAQYRAAITTHPIAARGFVSDLRGMQWADACVLVLPCGRSAHLEAGWFCGQGKRCLILTRDGEEPELMALLATDICTSIGEVVEALGTTPELLPALQLAECEMSAMRAAVGPGLLTDRAIEVARAAIAKVTGR